MACCKCKEYFWSDPQDPVYPDPSDKREYCLFHAPAEQKGMSPEDFNKKVFARIDAVIAKKDEEALCDLSGTVFPGDISFQRYKEDNPLPAIRFDGATFGGEVTFLGGKSGGHIGFISTTFGGNANFFVTTFVGEADFGEATFVSEARFWGGTFGGETSFHGIKAKRNSLHMQDLSESSLANLNFTSLETEYLLFKGCTWPEKLYLETTAKRDANFKAAEELYRSLKQKAASEHDQPLVSQWHFREKLMALEQIKKRHPALRFCTATWWYWALGGFAERPVRAWWWLFALVLLPGVVLGVNALVETGLSWGFDGERVDAVLKHWLPYMPFAKIDASGKDITGLKACLSWLSQLFIAGQTALFLLALRNRFRR